MEGARGRERYSGCASINDGTLTSDYVKTDRTVDWDDRWMIDGYTFLTFASCCVLNRPFFKQSLTMSSLRYHFFSE